MLVDTRYRTVDVRGTVTMLCANSELLTDGSTMGAHTIKRNSKGGTIPRFSISAYPRVCVYLTLSKSDSGMGKSPKNSVPKIFSKKNGLKGRGVSDYSDKNGKICADA